MTELGFTDDPVALVPGSVPGLYAQHDHWAMRADTATDALSRLGAVTIPDWSGGGADAFAARVRDAVGHWTRLSDAYLAAAAAIDGYVTTLAWAQQQAASAIDLWRSGQDADVAATSPSAGEGILFSDVPTGTPSFLAPPGAGDRFEAERILAAARSDVAEAGDSAAAALRAAAADPDVDAKVWAALGGVSTDPDAAVALLDGLTADEVLALLRLRPDLVGLLTRADPHRVAAWWSGLPDADRSSLIRSEPALIGNLEGVDYGSRDQANRLQLAADLVDAQAALATAQAQAAAPDWAPVGGPLVDLAAATTRYAALTRIQAALDQQTATAPRSLLSLTDGVPPLAAVSVGDPDMADDVTWNVPGMATTTAQMTQWTDSAQHLWEAQLVADPSHTHAVVAWMGYDTPPIPDSLVGAEVLQLDDAAAGAAHLVDTLGGFDAVRSDATVNVVAFSYGTTTSAIALTDPAVHVDGFVSVGSAGLPVGIDQASDLNADAVYAGQAQNVFPGIDQGDAWAWTGRAFGDHPVDPTGPTFGAHDFGTDSGELYGTPVTAHADHTDTDSGYLDPDTESLRNIAWATTGQGDLVSPFTPRPPVPLPPGYTLVEGR